MVDDKISQLSLKEHIERHQELHEKLVELLADFTDQTDGGMSSTILELIEWSFEQTKRPTLTRGFRYKEPEEGE